MAVCKPSPAHTWSDYFKSIMPIRKAQPIAGFSNYAAYQNQRKPVNRGFKDILANAIVGVSNG